MAKQHMYKAMEQKAKENESKMMAKRCKEM